MRQGDVLAHGRGIGPAGEDEFRVVGVGDWTEIEEKRVAGDEPLTKFLGVRPGEPAVSRKDIAPEIAPISTRGRHRPDRGANSVDPEGGDVGGANLLVGVDLHVGGMIDDDQPELINISSLPKLLRHLNRIPAVPRHHRGVDLQAFPFPRRHQLSLGPLQPQRRSPEEISRKHKLPAVPGVEVRAGAEQDLLLADQAVGSRLNDVLRHAIDPGHADHVGHGEIPQAEVGRTATNGARLVERPGFELEEAAEAVGVDPAARRHRRPLDLLGLEGHVDPVVRVATDVFEHREGAAPIADRHAVEIAVAVEVGAVEAPWAAVGATSWRLLLESSGGETE